MVQMRWAMVLVGACALAGCEDCVDVLGGGEDAAITTAEAIWTLDQPFPDIAHLNGIWGYTHDDLWAVGSKGTILHFDGASWEKVPTPTEEDLFDIDGHESMQDGDIDIYAVGASGTIIHWDGAVWSLEPPVPDVRLSTPGAVVTDTLMGVWHGRDDGIFVVGEKGTFLAKRRGPADPPDSAGSWALMYDEMVQERIPVCETRVAYNGSGYPLDGGGGVCAPCQIGPPGGDASAPLSMWQCLSTGSRPVPYCPGPDYNQLDCELPTTMRDGVDAQCSFGQRCEDDGVTPKYQVTFYKVDMKAVFGYGSGTDLRVIAVGESGAVVELRPTGSSGANATWDCEGVAPGAVPDSCWRPVARAGDTENPVVRDTLAGIWGQRWGGNTVYAVGEDGRLLWRENDDTWVRGTDPAYQNHAAFLSSPTPVFLRDVWHNGRNDFFVVGFSGVVLRHHDGAWGVEQVPTTAHLRSIWGKVRDDLDASTRDADAPALRSLAIVGSEGVILRRAIAR